MGETVSGDPGGHLSRGAQLMYGVVDSTVHLKLIQHWMLMMLELKINFKKDI